jgi:hypothetical protein
MGFNEIWHWSFEAFIVMNMKITTFWGVTPFPANFLFH